MATITSFDRRSLLLGACAISAAFPSRGETIADETLTACGGSPIRTSGNQDTKGYIAVDPYIKDYRRTIFILGWGQSHCAAFLGCDSGPYEAHPNVHMLDIHTGGLFRAQDPMLGCNGEHQCYLMRLGTLLIAADKADRVIITNIALGSTDIGRWARGGVCSHRFSVAAQRFRQYGWAPINLFFQGTIGEDDNQLGTSAVGFAEKGKLVASLARSAFGNPDAPFLITKTSYVDHHVGSAVQHGQELMANNSEKIFLSASTDDYIAGKFRASDGHLSAVGAAAVAEDCLMPSIGALSL